MLRNGNFLCVVAMTDLWPDVMVEVSLFSLKEKMPCHHTKVVSDDGSGRGWNITLPLTTTHHERRMFI